MGNPSGPAGHLPYKAEEFFLAGFATPSSYIDKMTFRGRVDNLLISGF